MERCLPGIQVALGGASGLGCGEGRARSLWETHAQEWVAARKGDERGRREERCGGASTPHCSRPCRGLG